MKLGVLLMVLFYSSHLLSIIGGNLLVHRDVKCKDAAATVDFKTITCPNNTGVIGLLDVKFGYQNRTENCTESQEILGCEEPMSNIQLRKTLNKLSAEPSYGALQFPQVDTPKHCHGYGNIPTYMVYYYQCIKQTSIVEMCSQSMRSGSEVSVYNAGYPGIRDVIGTHHCFCHVTTPAPSVYVTVYDYTINCTGNNQSVRIDSEDGNILPSQCDQLIHGQYNTSSGNLTISWDGQLRQSGLFWVGFRASDESSDVTMECSFIPDPTTTTTTTTTTTSAPISSSTQTSVTLSTDSVLLQSSVSSSSLVPSSTVSSSANSATSSTIAASSQQTVHLSKTTMYALIGSGAGVFVIIVVIICVIVQRRSRIQEVNTIGLQDILHNKSHSGSKT